VVVISHALNDRVFGGANSVGRDIRIEDKAYRVVGVLQPWAPQPRFYAVHLAQHHYGDGEDFFLPLQTARAAGLQPDMQLSYGNRAGQDLEAEPVIWLGVWVQLASANEAVAYRNYLAAYAREQIALGRFVRDRVALPDLMQWLQDQQVVPDQARLQTGLALSFLLICIVNTVGLLLAKCLRRSQEIGVRRALGASRSAIFVQFMVEASVIGLAGGLLGLVLAQFGLWCVRHQPTDYAGLAHLDATMLLVTFVAAWLASLLAGLLPAWRACAIAPALQLKSA
jgi:putative ABC transport system permease protein